MYLLQFFNTAVPLITVPYVTRVLGRDGYGVFSIALNIISYLQVVIEYGFGMSATRKVALGGKDKAQLNTLFSSVLLARVGLTLMCVVLSLAYCIFVTDEILVAISIMIMMTCLVGFCVQQNWLFQGMQEMKFISVVNIVGRTISTLLIFICVKHSSDILLYCLLFSISPLISGFVGLALAKRTYALRLVWVGFDRIYCELRDGFLVFTTQLSSKVFGSFGITVMGLICLPEDVGAFAAIQKIPNFALMLWGPVSQVLYPISCKRLKSSFSQGYSFLLRVRRYSLIAFGAICLTLIVFSRQIVGLLFGPEYEVNAGWIAPMLGWLIVAINDNFLGIQMLLGSGHDAEYSKCFQVSVIVTLVLNVILVHQFGGSGAAWAPLLSECILCGMLSFEVSKLLPSRG